VLGDSGKTYVEIQRGEGPLPLGAVYFLATGDGPVLEPIGSPDPRLLLVSTFVLGVQTPERLLNQLDVCSAIAREVPLFRLRIGRGVSAERLAATVHEHMARELGG
jgi:hypothetical protein